MKRLTLALLTILSLGVVNVAVAEAPANACTPHPDNPDGCNNWPPRRIDIKDAKVKRPFPWPGPVCLSCPSMNLTRDQLVINESILTPVELPSKSIQQLNHSRLNQERVQR